MFEATVINTIIGYWGYNQSPAILITGRDSLEKRLFDDAKLPRSLISFVPVYQRVSSRCLWGI